MPEYWFTNVDMILEAGHHATVPCLYGNATSTSVNGARSNSHKVSPSGMLRGKYRIAYDSVWKY